MDLLLFYSPGACSLAGQIVLEWIAQPYQLCRVEPTARGTEAFHRINPLGKVPALRTRDGVITETSAILLHLARRAPAAKLVPEEGTYACDEINQWLSYLGSEFHPAFYPYFSPARYSADATHHAAVREMAVSRVRAQFAYVDKALAGRDFLFGNARTVLDAYLHAMSRWGTRLVDVPHTYPNLARHQAMMDLDPAVQFGIATEHRREAKSPSGAFSGQVELNDL